jgi:branched-subunit amino acid transport protein
VRCSTGRVLAVLLVIYLAVLSPGLFFSAYLDSPVGVLVLLPYLSVYLFHALGVPGLLVHGGACGWGWCAPTVLGWLVAAGVGLGVLWLLAWGLARLCALGARQR